jgi:hypothetical protein
MFAGGAERRAFSGKGEGGASHPDFCLARLKRKRNRSVALRTKLGSDRRPDDANLCLRRDRLGAAHHDDAGQLPSG